MTHRFTAGDFDAFCRMQESAVAAIKHKLDQLEDGEQGYGNAFAAIKEIVQDAMDWKWVGSESPVHVDAAVRRGLP